MSRKTAIFAMALLIGLAVVLGLILVNKGDGPVAGMIISDREIMEIEAFQEKKSEKDNGLYLVLDKELNEYREKAKNRIPKGQDLYASIHVVESPKGSKFSARWITEGEVIKEETKELATNQKGIISYKLEGNKVKSGSYMIEIYSDNKKAFEYRFIVE